MMALLACIPGMPRLTFLALPRCWPCRLAHAPREPRPVAEPDQALQAPWWWSAAELDWRSLPVVEPLSLTVGYRLVSLIDQAQGAPLTQRVKGVRQTLSEQMGLLLPAIGVRDDLGSSPTSTACCSTARRWPGRGPSGPPDGHSLAADLRRAGRHARHRPRLPLPVVWIEPAGQGPCAGPGLPGGGCPA
jgi:hypothetical protein